MQIVFLGSSHFAEPSLRALLEKGYKISCVVTQPDRKKGRHLHLATTAVKTVAQDFGLKVYQPQRINEPEVIKCLRDFSPDLIIVVAYGQILSQEILDIPKIFSLNVHASLLPKYRGAAPINWAIIKGEKTTGISIIKMVKEMDAGPIILKEIVQVNDDDTSITLEEKLSQKGSGLLIDSLKSIENGNYSLIPQDENEVSFAPKLKKGDGRINWDRSAQDIYNLIRGSLSWPSAFTYYNGRLLKIYKAKVIRLSGYQVIRNPGEIIQISKDGIAVATGNGDLIIEELQIEGKRKMRIDEFIAGHKISVGARLG